ncbi:MAG TPA: hypothetical protein VGN72_06510 [Tepidisphaeraceae bacterium]|jgi:hypothetical protein|nr:hypothetical protein [Tepidisphaeraceae bacterium]
MMDDQFWHFVANVLRLIGTLCALPVFWVVAMRSAKNVRMGRKAAPTDPLFWWAFIGLWCFVVAGWK